MKMSDKDLRALPKEPGVYRFFNSKQELIYVGKAKNLRRRLAQYKKTTNKKTRKIWKSASLLSVETCASELHACLLEAELIRDLRPRLNVAGAYSFLYPMIGLKNNDRDDGCLEIRLTLRPEKWAGYTWYGAFRSRSVCGEGFNSLRYLMGFIATGRSSPASATFRRVPQELLTLISGFLRGESKEFLATMSLALVEKPSARNHSAAVQEHLKTLAAFFREEPQKLHKTLKKLNTQSYPVPQSERDFLFIRARYGPTSRVL